MNQISIDRLNFIDKLNEEFLSHTGYGAYAFLTTVEGVHLFDKYKEQTEPADQFIKRFVKEFI